MASDNTLLTIAVISVLVSLVVFIVVYEATSGILLSPGATANQTIATTNVTIVQNLVINFTDDKIVWGSGFVISGATNATLDTAQNLTLDSSGFTNDSSGKAGFRLQNLGNINASLYLKTGKTNVTFIGGGAGSFPLPDYRYNITEVEAGSCGAQNVTFGAYHNVNATGPAGSLVCGKYKWEDISDDLRIDIRIVIPEDAPSGEKIDTMTATAEVQI